MALIFLRQYCGRSCVWNFRVAAANNDNVIFVRLRVRSQNAPCLARVLFLNVKSRQTRFSTNVTSYTSGVQRGLAAQSVAVFYTDEDTQSA